MTFDAKDFVRFWSFVRIVEQRKDACWEWSGARDKDGYGFYKLRAGKQTKSHRIAWAFANSRDVPGGLVVMHRCDNPPCCNPAHLDVGTGAENTADAVMKARHPHAETHPMTKLSWDKVSEIRRLASLGVTQSAIGRQFGIAQAHISRIVLRKAWMTA